MPHVAMVAGSIGCSVREREENRFAGLVSRQSRFVFQVAWAVLRNAQDAEDVAQETFLKLYRTGSWERMEDERAFLARTAWRLAVDRLRRRPSGELQAEVRCPGENPEALAISADRGAALQRLIDRLPEDLRVPVGFVGCGGDEFAADWRGDGDSGGDGPDTDYASARDSSEAGGGSMNIDDALREYVGREPPLGMEARILRRCRRRGLTGWLVWDWFRLVLRRRWLCGSQFGRSRCPRAGPLQSRTAAILMSRPLWRRVRKSGRVPCRHFGSLLRRIRQRRFHWQKSMSRCRSPLCRLKRFRLRN